ncbi:Cytochrome P450 [Streptomyces sp. yr375]|uniref:cytochrome P450 n=1 Tax=Streptomyces sp. yr375 TaxID=1761906 RepID=UPI0008BA1C48|nr:cytochrome P450 [Streptomyces sp. yr375]SES49617.1 Cytochrome P450 [Streptomyces sp. yr375]
MTQLETMPVEPLLTHDYEIRRAEIHDELRERYGVVAPVDLLGTPVWLVLGYDEALAVLRDDNRWKKSLTYWRAYAEGRIPADWPLLPALECDMMVFFDDQRHRTARAAFERAVRPFQDPSRPSARQLRALITQYADELITFLAGGGAGRSGIADLCGQYARPLLLMVTNRLLGFADAKGDEVTMDVWRVLDAGPDAAAAIERLMAALQELVLEKRALPGDDIPSYMLAADPSVSTEELAWELYLVVCSTVDLVGTLLCNTVVEVLTGDTGARASLSAGMVGETVNRAALANPPMHNLTFRFPVTAVSLGGFVIAAGDPVMVSPAAAHTDPLFAQGIARNATVSSRAHLAFGAGPHQCPGRDLASSIVAIGVQRLFERFTDLRLTLPKDQLPWRTSPLVSGLRSLPVRYVLSDGPVSTVPFTPSAPVAPVVHATPEVRVTAEVGAFASDGSVKPARSAFWRMLDGFRRRPDAG